MRKPINAEHIEGYLFQHDLKIKTVQNSQSENYGKEFIGGSLDIAVDEEGLNVINVRYTYVTPTTKSGGENRTYTALKNIIESGKTWVTDGKDAATKLRCEPALALNDFIGQDGTPVSQKVNEGGFVTILTSLNPDMTRRNTFKTDIVITSVNHVDADPEKNISAPYASIRGAVFNFRNALLPVEFIARSEGAIKYFESLDIDAANPVYTCVWGRINSTTEHYEITEESAFGEASVTVRDRKVREYVITGANKMPYDFGDPEVLTAEDLTKAMQDREVYLADVKKRDEEYKASKAAGSATPVAPAAAVSKASFSF